MQKTLKIQNLKCGGCARTITTKISEIQDVDNVIVNIENSTVTFDYPNEETLSNVTAKLARIGYPKEGNKNTIGSKAKSFVSCASGRMTT